MKKNTVKRMIAKITATIIISVIEQTLIRNKIESFKRLTKTRKAIQVVFVTTYGVRQNAYSSIIQGQVTLDELFGTN